MKINELSFDNPYFPMFPMLFIFFSAIIATGINFVVGMTLTGAFFVGSGTIAILVTGIVVGIFLSSIIKICSQINMMNRLLMGFAGGIWIIALLITALKIGDILGMKFWLIVLIIIAGIAEGITLILVKNEKIKRAE